METSTALTDLVIITGYSGAGKSTAMAVFEDEGYFCVDNLPSEMISSLVELFMHAGSKVQYAAVVSDVRAGNLFEGLASKLDQLRANGLGYRVLFQDLKFGPGAAVATSTAALVLIGCLLFLRVFRAQVGTEEF